MLYFFLAFVISLVSCLVIRRTALAFAVVDHPDGGRKLHNRAVPLLGGMAIFLGFWLVAGSLLLFNPIRGLDIIAPRLLGVFIASLLVMVVGFFDDVWQIPAWLRFFAIGSAALCAVVFGLGLETVTNPTGGVIDLGRWALQVGAFTVTAGTVVVFFWLAGMMFTTKVLDGLDGLSTGIVAIGAFVIALFTRTTLYAQDNVHLLSLIFLGALLGFLVLNIYPAKLFLGEGGSIFIGLILGTLAVVAGGKLAIALLVMAIPILDLARVMVVRWRSGRSLFTGDREHLHFRLVDKGLSVRSGVLVYYTLAFVFGISTLFLQSLEKVYALGVLFVVMVGLVVFIHKK